MNDSRLWTSGHNKAGFLPDTAQPPEPCSWEEAWQSLFDELSRAEFDAMNDEFLALTDVAIALVKATPGESFAVTVRVPGELPEEWWIHRAEPAG